jgi:hypothetical protein
MSIDTVVHQCCWMPRAWATRRWRLPLLAKLLTQRHLASRIVITPATAFGCPTHRGPDSAIADFTTRHYGPPSRAECWPVAGPSCLLRVPKRKRHPNYRYCAKPCMPFSNMVRDVARQATIPLQQSCVQALRLRTRGYWPLQPPCWEGLPACTFALGATPAPGNPSAGCGRQTAPPAALVHPYIRELMSVLPVSLATTTFAARYLRVLCIEHSAVWLEHLPSVQVSTTRAAC